MKIICTQENLQKGLSIVSPTIKKTTSLPILANVLISTYEGRIKFSTTNLEIGTICFVRGKIEKEGKTTVPAHLIYNYISNLPPGKILLESNRGDLNLECENFKATIKSLDPSEFPLIPKIEGNSLCKIQAEDLKKALTQVVFAATSDEIRPEIAGIYLKLEKDKIRLAATDSYRLAEKIIKTKTEKEARLIVPKTTMVELLRVLSKVSDGLVEVFISENQIRFKYDEIELISRLVDGQYPDYLKIIPEKFSTKFKVKKEEFISALRSASLFSKIDGNEVETEINPSSNKIKLSSESGQIGQNTTLISGEGEGKEEKIVLNYQYVLDGLNAVNSDFINLMLSGDIGPAQLKPDGEEDYTYIIMPIKK